MKPVPAGRPAGWADGCNAPGQPPPCGGRERLRARPAAERRFPVTARSNRRTLALVAALLGFALLAALPPTVASATSTKEQLDQAKKEYDRLKDEIAGEQARLKSLQSQAYQLAGEIEAADGRLEKAVDALRRTRQDIADAQGQLDDLRAKLAERAREAYIQGPGNDLEFLLGATSLLDLADRLQYVEALSQADVDLATEVQNLTNKLKARAASLKDLEAEREAAVADLKDRQDQLFARLLDEQLHEIRIDFVRAGRDHGRRCHLQVATHARRAA